MVQVVIIIVTIIMILSTMINININEMVKFWRYSGWRKCRILISSIDDRFVCAVYVT